MTATRPQMEWKIADQNMMGSTEASKLDRLCRVAVIGAGYWAQNMLRAIEDSRTTELVTICDTNQVALDALAKKYPNAQLTTSFDGVTTSDVDAVYIATPPSTHFALAIAALRAGKHVLVEKPMTTTTEQSERLLEESEMAGRTLMVGHTFLFSPPVLKIKEMLTAGIVGEAFYIDSHRVNLGKYQDSGVMWDLAPHDLSIIFYWLGETPTSVIASGRSFRSSQREDVAFLTLDFPSGATAQLHLSWLSPVKLRRTTLSGSRKMVIYDDTAGQEAVKVFDHGVDLGVPSPETFGEFQLMYRQGDIWIPHLETSEPLRNEWEHFIDCIATGALPRSSAAQGLAVVKTLEAADRSFHTKSTVLVEWNRHQTQTHERPRFGAAIDPATQHLS